jgi:hypothetical protein
METTLHIACAVFGIALVLCLTVLLALWLTDLFREGVDDMRQGNPMGVRLIIIAIVIASAYGFLFTLAVIQVMK